MTNNQPPGVEVNINNAEDFVKRIFRKRRESVIVSLIVGVHSANWLTVGTISNVQELLVVFRVMLAVINYARWREQGTNVPETQVKLIAAPFHEKEFFLRLTTAKLNTS